MKKKLLIIFFWIVLGPIFHLSVATIFTLGMNTLFSDEEIRVIGIFAPAGKIRVELKKEILSLEGYHSGIADIAFSEKSTGPGKYLWNKKITFGESWGKTVLAKKSTIKCKIPLFKIPKNIELTTKLATINVGVTIFYPEYTSASYADLIADPGKLVFKDSEVSFRKVINIPIGKNAGRPFSIRERLGYFYNYSETIAIVIFIIWFLGLVYLIDRYKNKKA